MRLAALAHAVIAMICCLLVSSFHILQDLTHPIAAPYQVVVGGEPRPLGADGTKNIEQHAFDAGVIVSRMYPNPIDPLTSAATYVAGADAGSSHVTELTRTILPNDNTAPRPIRDAQRLSVNGQYYVYGTHAGAASFAARLHTEKNPAELQPRPQILSGRELRSKPVFLTTWLAALLMGIGLSIAQALSTSRSDAARILMGHQRWKLLRGRALRNLVVGLTMCAATTLCVAGVAHSASVGHIGLLTTTTFSLQAITVLCVVITDALVYALLLRSSLLSTLKGAALPNHARSIVVAVLVPTLILTVPAFAGATMLERHDTDLQRSAANWRVLPHMAKVGPVPGKYLSDSEFSTQVQRVGGWLQDADRAGEIVRISTSQTDDYVALDNRGVPVTTVVEVNRRYLDFFNVDCTIDQPTCAQDASKATVLIPPHLGNFMDILKPPLERAITSEAEYGHSARPSIDFHIARQGSELFIANVGNRLSGSQSAIRDPIVIIYPGPETFQFARQRLVGNDAGATIFVSESVMLESAQRRGGGSVLSDYLLLASSVSAEIRTAAIAALLSTVQLTMLALTLLLGNALLAWMWCRRHGERLFVERLAGRRWASMLRTPLLRNAMVATALFMAVAYMNLNTGGSAGEPQIALLLVGTAFIGVQLLAAGVVTAAAARREVALRIKAHT